MKFNRKELHAALLRIGGAVESKGTIPILKMVKLEAEGERLAITASRLDWAAETALKATESHDQLSVCAPFAQVFSFIDKANADEVSLVQDGERIKLEAGKMRAAFATRSVNDFPACEFKEGDTEISVKDLEFLLRSSMSFATDDENRYALEIIRLSEYRGKFAAASTDKNVLVLATVATDAPKDWAVFIPYRAARAVLAGISGAEKVLFSSDDKKVYVSTPRLKMFAVGSTKPFPTVEYAFNEFDKKVTPGFSVGAQELATLLAPIPTLDWAGKTRGVAIRASADELAIEAVGSTDTYKAELSGKAETLAYMLFDLTYFSSISQVAKDAKLQCDYFVTGHQKSNGSMGYSPSIKITADKPEGKLAFYLQGLSTEKQYV